ILRSIANAARTERFFRKPGFTQRILIGTENLRRASDALMAEGRPVHEINYEDLTKDPSRCMQRICRFLEIPFDERMTTLAGADRSAIASGAHHLKVRGNTILGQKARGEVLAPALEAKIIRYICRWKQQYEGKWPRYPMALPAGARRPSVI